MNRRLFVSILAIFIVSSVIGCNRQPQTESTKDYRIGFVMKTLNNPFFIRMEEGAMECADSLNVELVVQAADREIDVERQMQIIENLIETKVDALCITPSGSREVVTAIAKANCGGYSRINCRYKSRRKNRERYEGKFCYFYRFG